MAMALVSGQNVSTVGTIFDDSTHALSFPVAATAGNLIVVVCTFSAGNDREITSIADNGTTAYSRIRTEDDLALGAVVEIWAGIAAGANAGISVTITAAVVDASTNLLMGILEFSGADSNLTAVPAASADTAGVTTHSSGTVTPDSTHNVIVGLSRGTAGTYTTDATFTNIVNDTRQTYGYLIQSAATADTFSPTSVDAESTVVAAVAFRGTADAGGGTAHFQTTRRLMMGG